MKSASLLLALAALTACATQPTPPAPEPTNFIVPSPPPEPRIETRVVAVPVPTGAPRDMGRRADPKTATTRAYYDSLEMPDPSKFAGKDLQYPYDANLWYQVYTEVGQKTLIRLEAGEKVRNFEEEGGGALWRNTLNYYGGDSGTSRYPVISIKPVRHGIKTQYTIFTNRRKYDLRVTAFKEQPEGKALKHVEVSWYYPQQEYQQMQATLQNASAELGGSGGNDLADIAHSGATDDVLPGCKNGDTYYRVTGTTGVPWYPTPTPDGLPKVCDDGRMVRINFPATLGTTEGPSLWEAEDYHGNNARLLRYRAIGSAYVVDNLPRVMLLRQGVAEIKIVRTRD
jgi:type IV secretory pathway VirB9-like protein